MNCITVFCGSSYGKNEVYKTTAYELGKRLAENGINLIYGGASVGLMGTVADGALQNGGRAIGVLPRFLSDRELAHKDLTELIVVETMHERKYRMSELCDGVIAMPGGFGTIEELFEMLTWAQLGLHHKPVGILNIDGFYDELLMFVETMIEKGFLREINREFILVDSDIDGLLDKMRKYVPPTTAKSFDRPK